MATAIVDRLTVTVHQARTWLKQSNAYATVQVQVLPSPPASTAVWLAIGTRKITVTTAVSPTVASVAAQLVAAITAAAITNVTATDNGSGLFTIAITTGTFTLSLDPYQDIVATTADDFMLASLITVAKRMADDYCNNDWSETDDEGVVTLTAIPDAVRVGVLQMTANLWKQRSADAGEATAGGPVSSQSAGSLSVSYAGQQTAIDSLVRNILGMYRLIPGSREILTTPARLSDMLDEEEADEDDDQEL